MAVRFPSYVHATVIDNEALLISFETGFYYSVTGSGSEVVKALLAHPLDPALEGEAVKGFIDQLVTEKLVEETTTDAQPSGLYNASALIQHAELADILSLDPIHQTSPTGWPSKV